MMSGRGYLIRLFHKKMSVSFNHPFRAFFSFFRLMEEIELKYSLNLLNELIFKRIFRRSSVTVFYLVAQSANV